MANIMITLGVLADTHIPDKAPKLNPQVTSRFKQAGVSAILHAGDITSPGVLVELKQIAPVYAVLGNQDIFALRHLPTQVRLNLAGIKLGMAHGHGTFVEYWRDKIVSRLRGKRVGRYIQRMLRTFPEVDVIVFGHLHVPCNFHLEGKLFFNPGSTTFPWPRMEQATFGLLTLEQGKEPRGEIIELE
jgi:putative phosphoesterase